MSVSSKPPRSPAVADAVAACIIRALPDALVCTEADGVVCGWSEAAERLFGFSESEALGHPVDALIVPERRRQAHRAALRRLTTGETATTPTPWRERTRALHRDGHELPVEVTVVPVVVDGALRLHAVVRDIAERVATEEALHEAHDRFQRAFFDAPIGMALVAPDGVLLAVNPGLAELLGRPASELQGTCLAELTHPADVRLDAGMAEQVLRGERDRYQVDKRYLRADGREIWAQLSASVVRDTAGRPAYFVAQLQDVGERKQAEQQLRHYAEHLNALTLTDPLTGLRNRREFERSVDRELRRARRHGGEFTVAILDLKDFSAINRAQGDFAGDELLRAAAHAVAQSCRGSDVAARVGGDQFGLLLVAAGELEAGTVVERTRAALAVIDRRLRATAGLASFPGAGESVPDLIRAAETALDAKRPVASPTSSGTATDPIVSMLNLAREQLDMQIAYLTEHTEAEQRFRFVAGRPTAFGPHAGTGVALNQTYCHLMLSDRLPSAVRDTRAHPLTATMDVTLRAGISAYVGVPVRLSTGELYGTLCTIDEQPRPALSERDVALMEFLARLIAERIEHDHSVDDERRAHAELSGMHALLAALAARDQYTSEHSRVVVGLATGVARHLGLAAGQIATVEQIAVLHDIGKVGIPDAVLQNPGPLGPAEWRLMRQHPVIGARMLEASSGLAHLAPAVRAEHERWDGTGYPDRLAGQQIPLASRITLACDAYHAMTSDRPYRRAMSPDDARRELRANAGSQFDPLVVDALLHVLAGEHDAPATPHPELLATSVLDAGPAEAPTPGADVLGREPTGTVAELRCACQDCGAHVPGTLSDANLTGWCPNCGSYDIAIVRD